MAEENFRMDEVADLGGAQTPRQTRGEVGDHVGKAPQAPERPPGHQKGS